MKSELFAFWRYDGFPFVLGAPVKKLLSDGCIQPEGYGGYAFRPVLIVPPATGAVVQERLRALEREYSRAQRRLRDEYVRRAASLFTDVGLRAPDHLK